MFHIRKTFELPHRRCTALILIFLSACRGGITTTPVPPELTRCVDPRPEVCAQVYLPVCGTRDARLVSDWKTYSNACTACADPAVYAHRPGTCNE